MCKAWRGRPSLTLAAGCGHAVGLLHSLSWITACVRIGGQLRGVGPSFHLFEGPRWSGVVRLHRQASEADSPGLLNSRVQFSDHPLQIEPHMFENGPHLFPGWGRDEGCSFSEVLEGWAPQDGPHGLQLDSADRLGGELMSERSGPASSFLSEQCSLIPLSRGTQVGVTVGLEKV